MDAVATATADVPRIKPLGSAPDKDTGGQVIYPYGVFSAQFGRGDAYALDASAGLRWVRVTGQFFGKTTAATLDHAEKFIAALVDKALTTTDVITTPLRIELDPTPPTRDPDASGVLGLTLTLTATAEES